jgi:tRNA modification GTPase
VLDRSEPLKAEDELLLAQTSGRRRIIVANKSDLPAACDVGIGRVAAGGLLTVSAKTGAGADDLRLGIASELMGSDSLRDTAAISNVRHVALVEQARASLATAEQAVAAGGTPEEFVLADLQAARARLEEIVGARTSEDLLRHIFEKFCIGK